MSAKTREGGFLTHVSGEQTFISCYRRTLGPQKGSEGVSEGLSEGVSEGFSKGFRRGQPRTLVKGRSSREFFQKVCVNAEFFVQQRANWGHCKDKWIHNVYLFTLPQKESGKRSSAKK